MKIIFLILIGVNLSFASDVFNDSKTGLVWQDNSAAKETKMNWQDSVDYCSKLNLAGYNDWRLPSIKELQSIIDINRHKPAIKKGFNYVGTSKYYWSSSVDVSRIERAWIVGFLHGHTQSYYKTSKIYVRCVRYRQ